MKKLLALALGSTCATLAGISSAEIRDGADVLRDFAVGDEERFVHAFRALESSRR